MTSQQPSERRVVLSDLTLYDVEQFFERSRTIIIPVGATEQHGAHAPFGTDSILATEVSIRLARRIDALVAPTLTYGVSGDHEGYAGVPFVSPSTMTALVQDVVLSFAGGGFREMILVNGHYTNSMVLSAAVMEIGDRLPEHAVAFPFNYWDALPPEQLADFLGPDVGLHANVGETSAILAIDESLVEMSRAKREYPAFPVTPTPAMISAYFFSARGTLPRASNSGVWGDPSVSTAEQGHRFLDQIEEASVRFVQEVRSLFEAFPERAS